MGKRQQRVKEKQQHKLLAAVRRTAEFPIPVWGEGIHRWPGSQTTMGRGVAHRWCARPISDAGGPRYMSSSEAPGMPNPRGCAPIQLWGRPSCRGQATLPPRVNGTIATASRGVRNGNGAAGKHRYTLK